MAEKLEQIRDSKGAFAAVLTDLSKDLDMTVVLMSYC